MSLLTQVAARQSTRQKIGIAALAVWVGVVLPSLMLNRLTVTILAIAFPPGMADIGGGFVAVGAGFHLIRYFLRIGAERTEIVPDRFAA